jgi:hypothetical protein
MDMTTQKEPKMNIEIEYELTGAVQDYAMFTELGNAAVHALVVSSRVNSLTWPQTYRALCKLSEHKEFGEATDTAVRECVYSALGFDTPFYC